MELKYRYSESTVRPEAIQIDGDTVYLRKDISELKREDDQGNKTTYWTYQEATMTVAEFNQHANAILISGQKMAMTTCWLLWKPLRTCTKPLQ